MLAWLSLPTHVWALVLRHVSVHELFVVAHTCRALHVFVFSESQCTCGTINDDGGHTECARSRAFWTHLIDAGSTPTPFSEWQAFAEAGYVTHVTLALRLGFDPSTERQAGLIMACRYGHVALVDRLLRDERVDPSTERQEGLIMACRHGHAALVDRLLRDDRVDPSPYHQHAMHLASIHGHLDVVQRLLLDERVANDVARLREFTSEASWYGHDAIAALLERHCSQHLESLAAQAVQ